LPSVFFVPGAIFGLAGGALFGPLWGTLLNLAGATLGATASFLIARYVAADWVRSKVGGRLQRLVAGVEAEGWRFVAFVRLVPLFPFNLLNYALGLTQIPLTQYVLASLVCMAPGTLAYAWLGYAGREALADNQSAINYGLIALALLAAVALLPRLIRRLSGDRELQWIEIELLASWLKDGANVSLTWMGDTFADAYNGWFVTSKVQVPDAHAGPPFVATPVPTCSAVALTTCDHAGIVPGPAGTTVFYNIRGLCGGEEAPE